MASINEKLTRINESISDLKNELQLDKNVSIENIKSAIIPSKGITYNKWNENGDPIQATLYGFNIMPNNYFSGKGSIKTLFLKDDLQLIYMYGFKNSSLQHIKRIDGQNPFKEVTEIGNEAFAYCSNLEMHSLCLPKIKVITLVSSDYRLFSSNTMLKGVWIGKDIVSIGKWTFSLCSGLKKIYVDLPRATVEAFYGYKYAFCNNELSQSIIVCNDDPGFLTQEEFNAIDWATYTK